MPQIETTNIYYSKTAYRFGLFATVIIFFTGIALITVIQNGAWDFTVHIFSKYGFIGILLIAGSVLIGRVYLKKLSITAPAIIIDGKGISINNKRQQFIPWVAIDHIKVLEVNSDFSSNNNAAYKDKYIVPVLKDPKAYLNDTTRKALDALKKLNIEANTSQPIRISTNFLRCSFDELKNILENGLAEYNASQGH